MLVIYRITGIPSTNPSPIYQEDKKKLNELCLKSFELSFAQNPPDKVIFLCDYCDDSYKELIEKNCSFNKEIIFTSLGINGTMLKAYELAEAIEGNILFLECDYIWRPSCGKLMNDAISHFGLISPYDHLNFYIDRSIHSKTCDIELFGNQHYRTTERNTMTFGMTSEVFKKHKDTLIKYGYLDNDVWHEMRANGNPLWVPVPSFATHMVKDYLAPVIPWEMIWRLVDGQP